MNTNKIIVYITLIFVLLVIGIPTFYKVTNLHQDNLIKVTDKKIIEAAKKCYYEGKCLDTRITLESLYTNNYLTDDVIDPISKVVYSKNSYVLNEKDEFTFFPIK